VQPGDPLGLRSRLAKHSEWISPTLEWILSLDEDSFLKATRHNALRRPGLRGLIRNALVAAGNSHDPRLRPLIEHHAENEDPMLREHACWALARLDSAAG
jgi:epoxyqueuosine reductase